MGCGIEPRKIDIAGAESLHSLEPQLAELKDMQAKTADLRDLFDANLKIEELEERWQELIAALQALTAESNKHEQAD
jgi:hypothetical protein